MISSCTVAINQEADMVLIHDARAAAMFYSLSSLKKIDGQDIPGASKRHAPVPVHIDKSARYAVIGDGGSFRGTRLLATANKSFR